MLHAAGHPPLPLGALVSPGLFAAGAACAGIPIIIHLLSRRRFRKVRWAAVEFLLDAQRRNQRRVRFEELILLALRCLAMLLIALMVARYFASGGGSGRSPLGGVRRDHFLLIDDSFSMGLKLDDGSTVFDRAGQTARRILEDIMQGGGSDTVTVIGLSEPREPVIAGAFPAREDAQTLLSRVAGMRLSQRRATVAGAAQRVRDELDAHPEIIDAVVYVMSDFQASDWIDASMARDPEIEPSPGKPTQTTPVSGLDPLNGWSTEDRALQVVLLGVGDPRAANRAIHDAVSQTRLPVMGNPVQLTASFSNFSDSAAENVELRAEVAETIATSQVLPRVAPHQSAQVRIEATFPTSGATSVALNIPHDRLEIDDVAWFATDVLGAIRVMVVDGEPSSDAFLDEVHLLTTALRPAGAVFSGNEVTIVDAALLESTDLRDFHVVILANLPVISDAAGLMLRRFVQEGGGLVCFLGDQVDAESYNAQWGGEDGLLPTRLGDPVDASDQPRRLVVRDPRHPVLDGVSREGDPLGLGLVRFGGFVQSYALEEPPESGAEPEPDAARPSMHVLAEYDGEGSFPAIVEKSHGDGRVILITSSADKEWNTWADSPTYLPVMLELVAYAARPVPATRTLRVGETLKIELDADRYEPLAFLRTPGYPDEAETPLTGVVREEGRILTFTCDSLRRHGVHELHLQLTNARQEERRFAVELDPVESDLTAARAEELRAAMPDLPLEFVGRAEDYQPGRSGGGHDWWKAFLAAACVTLMLEHTLAWAFGRASGRAGAAHKNIRTTRSFTARAPRGT